LRSTLRKNFRDFLDRVPVACRRGRTQEFLDFAEVADRFHLPTIQTQDESVLDRNDLQQPVIVWRQTQRERWRRAEWFMQHIYEPGYVRARGLSNECVLCGELHDVARGTNHDLAFEWQLASNCSAQTRFAHIFAHNKRADCANVYDTELRQLLCDQGGLASVGAADVHRAKKNDGGHQGSKSEEAGIRKQEVKIELNKLLCALRVFCS
jgi:hypothetical protein